MNPKIPRQNGSSNAMNEEEKELAKLYGITVEHKTVYLYQGHRYERLNDALNYAKLDTERRQRPDHG